MYLALLFYIFTAMMMFIVCAILGFMRGEDAYYVAFTFTFIFGKLFPKVFHQQ